MPGDRSDLTLWERLLIALVIAIDLVAGWGAAEICDRWGWTPNSCVVMGTIVFFVSLPIHLWGLDTVVEARRKREMKAFKEKLASRWRPGGDMYEMQAPLDP